MKNCLYLQFVLAVILQLVLSGTPDQWRSRTIYQLLTDRFGRSDNSTNGCENFSDYCGGTFQGIIYHLDYIQGMGFDAIWISPIPTNYPGGYHGYWQTNIYEVNPNFGAAEDLKRLVEECHKRGIWVMLDVVGNHVGPVGYTYNEVVPFNQSSHYHDCSICPSGCTIQDFTNQPQVEHCRLAGLPDLAQENSFVSDTLTEWIANTVSNFSFDGLRIDTTPEVPKSFWSAYMSAANVYAVGEVYNGDPNYVGGYQAPNGPLPGVLSYPLFFTLRSVFAQQQSMYNIQNVLQSYQTDIPDQGLLGTFIDNHDQVRFLNQQQDLQLYKNAIVYTLMSEGIPIIYYGTEQEYSGGSDPGCREPLWPTGYNTQTELYLFIQQVVNFRKQNQIWENPQIQRYADNNFYAFTRGNVFVAMTNGGSNQPSVQVTITYHPYADGTKLCNLFYPDSDCLVVENGQFEVYLANGECKIYYPPADESHHFFD